MTDHINPTHAILDAATDPLCLDQIAGKIHCAKPTKAQIKAVERQLKALHTAGLLESTPGRGGLPHYSLTTPTAEPAPQPRPSAAAVAVHAALDGGTDPAPGIAEQLRHAHAERLAMRQTIIAICCAIGRDPGQTTTTELQQAVKDAITEARNSAAYETEKALMELSRERFAMTMIRKTLAPITAELFEGDAYTCTESEAIRTMSQLIDAQHELMLDQGQRIADQERETTELRAQIEAQSAQHQAETGLLADKNAKLHAEIEHLRSRPTPVACVTAAPEPEAFFVLRHDWKHHVTRHKSRETAERTVTSALRAGAGQADIYAAKRIAIGKRHPVIKAV